MVKNYRIFDNLIEGAQVISPDFRYLYVNNAVCIHAKKTPGELVGRKMVDVFPGIDTTTVFQLIESCLVDHKHRELVNEFAFDDGSTGYFQLRLQPVPEGVLIMSFDVTSQVLAEKVLREANVQLEQLVQERTRELHDANVELEKLVETDALTGLNNRRHFDERLRQEIARSRRHENPLAIAMLDLDHFKAINDGHGHDIGDCALRSIANLLKAQARETDSISRIGGEEFVLLMVSTGESEAIAYAKRIRETIEGAPIVCEDSELSLTCSIGVAVLSAEVRDAEHLLKRADSAMYEAKNRGRNAVCVYVSHDQGSRLVSSKEP